MSREIALTVEVVEPYTIETLHAFGIAMGTVEEYAFCLGWQDGATNYLPSLPPVTKTEVFHYQSGWALGSLNRIAWLIQGARQVLAEAE